MKFFESRDEIKAGMHVLLDPKSYFFKQCQDENGNPISGIVNEQQHLGRDWVKVTWKNGTSYSYECWELSLFADSIKDNEDALALLKNI